MKPEFLLRPLSKDLFKELLSGSVAAHPTAMALCREHGLPVRIFNINPEGNIVRAVTGNPGTLIQQGE